MLPLFRQSLANPRDAAHRLLSIQQLAAFGPQAIVLVAALSALMAGGLSGGELPMPAGEGTVNLSPLAYAAVLLLILGLGSVTLTVAGRALGGTGTVAGALVLVAWLQAIDVALQVVVLVVAIVMPPLLPLIALAGLAALLWCLMGFVQALHGFGPGRALGAILLAALGLGVTLAVLLGFSGLGVAPDV